MNSAFREHFDDEFQIQAPMFFAPPESGQHIEQQQYSFDVQQEQDNFAYDLPSFRPVRDLQEPEAFYPQTKMYANRRRSGERHQPKQANSSNAKHQGHIEGLPPKAPLARQFSLGQIALPEIDEQQNLNNVISSLQQEIKAVLVSGADYDRASQAVLQRFMSQHPDIDRKLLTRVWLYKILEFQQSEHKVRRSSVAEKLMSSPERDKELLKERLELVKEQEEPLVKKFSFMGRFSDNDATKRHKMAVVEQQRSALLQQMAERQQQQNLVKQREEQYLKIEQKQLPFPQASKEESEPRNQRAEVKDGDPEDPTDFKPKGRQLFQSQISIGSDKKEGSIVRNSEKIGNNLNDLSMSSHAKVNTIQQSYRPPVNFGAPQAPLQNPQPNYQQHYSQPQQLQWQQQQQLQQQIAQPSYMTPEQNAQYQAMQKQLMEDRIKTDQAMLQAQANTFMSMLQNLVSETVSATQVQHHQLQSLLGLSGNTTSQQVVTQPQQVVGVRLPSSFLPQIQRLESAQLQQQVSSNRSSSATRPPLHNQPISRMKIVQRQASETLSSLPQIEEQLDDADDHFPEENNEQYDEQTEQKQMNVQEDETLYKDPTQITPTLESNLKTYVEPDNYQMTSTKLSQSIQAQDQLKSQQTNSKRNSEDQHYMYKPSSFEKQNLAQQILDSPPSRKQSNKLVSKISSNIQSARQMSSLGQNSNRSNEKMGTNLQGLQPDQVMTFYEKNSEAVVQRATTSKFKQSIHDSLPQLSNKSINESKKASLVEGPANAKDLELEAGNQEFDTHLKAEKSKYEQRLKDIELSLLSKQEQERITQMAQKQEELTRRYLEEIKHLTEEKQRLAVDRQRHEMETKFLQQEGTLQHEMNIYQQKELEMNYREQENQKKLAQLQKALNKEKVRPRYKEASIVDGTRNPDAAIYQWVGQPTFQKHDGQPFGPEDSDRFVPVTIPSTGIYDPEADVFVQDIAQPFMPPILKQIQADEEDYQDFDRVMHENFQYEQTMNKAHLKKFNLHTSELMFSRAAMRQFHENKKSSHAFEENQFNLAADGASQVDQTPQLNRMLHDGYVNIGTDEQDEVYHNYVLKHEIDVDNLADLQPLNQMDEKLYGFVKLQQNGSTEAGYYDKYKDYTDRKQLHQFQFEEGPIDLCYGVGSQHSSFLAKENDQLKSLLDNQTAEQEMKLRVLRLAKINGILHMPETQIRFHQPASQTQFQPTKSNMISNAIRKGIEDMKKIPKRSEDNKIYNEVKLNLGLERSYSQQELTQGSYYKETRSEIVERPRKSNIPVPSYKYFKSDTRSDLFQVRHAHGEETKNNKITAIKTSESILSETRQILQQESSQFVPSISQKFQRKDSQEDSLHSIHRIMSEGEQRLHASKTESKLPPIMKISRAKVLIQRIGSAISRGSASIKRSLSRISMN